MHLFGSHKVSHGGGTYFQVRNYIRVVVLGAEGVGKTTLIHQCLHNTFIDEHKCTIEDQYFYNGHNFDIEILDTSGSFNFPDMMKLAIQQGDVFVLVFSVTDYRTFDRVTQLRRTISEMRGRVPIIVVGNKADLDNREVPRDIADAVVSIDWDATYHDVTATSHNEVTAIFNDIFTHYPSLCGETINLRDRTSRCRQRDSSMENKRKDRKSARLSDFVKKLLAR